MHWVILMLYNITDLYSYIAKGEETDIVKMYVSNQNTNPLMK